MDTLDLHEIHQIVYSENGKNNYLRNESGREVLDINEKNNRLAKKIDGELPNYPGLVYELNTEKGLIKMKFKGKTWTPKDVPTLPKEISDILDED